MKSIASAIVAVGLLALILPAQAQQQRSHPEGAAPEPQASVGDPLQRLYRVSGVRDNGGGIDSGQATSFHCTSISTVNETLQIRVRDFNGTPVGTRSIVITPNRTRTLSTHLTRLFFEDATLSPGEAIEQGSAEILATSSQVFCSAMIISAAANVPEGIELHLVRFNAIPGSQE